MEKDKKWCVVLINSETILNHRFYTESKAIGVAKAMLRRKNVRQVAVVPITITVGSTVYSMSKEDIEHA